MNFQLKLDNETNQAQAEYPERLVLPSSIKPYYSDDLITLYLGDCCELLPHMPSVEMVLTDPPYNVGIKYGYGVDDRMENYAQWCNTWYALCRKKCKVMAFSPGISNISLWVKIENPKWVIAWLKPAAMGRCPIGFNNWEPCLVYGKPQHSNGVDVVTAGIVPDGECEGHPCPKPLKWASGIIQQLTKSGTILDPFAGSGTTLRAAKDLGRQAIGIEINEMYCEIIAKRMSQGVLNLRNP